MISGNSGARGRKKASPLNQAVERVQPSPLTDEAVLSPEVALSNLPTPIPVIERLMK